MGSLSAIPLIRERGKLKATECPSSIVDHLSRTRQSGTKDLKILDVGPAVGSNVEFYSTFATRIYIEDLYASLSAARKEKPKDSLALFNELLPYTEDIHFDYIMCWDLLNYLTASEITAFGQHLLKFSHPGTNLFAMISIAKSIPSAPRNYKITPEMRLLYEPTTSELIKCPRYNKNDISHLLPQFVRQRSFLLRNGTEEQLLVAR